MASMMCLRDRPPSFAPGPIGFMTLVAMTAWWRGMNSLTSVPVISSLTPLLYTSAVSKKLMPPSAARRTNGRASSSESVHGKVPCPGVPKLIMPRQMRLTFMPVLPSRTYSMVTSPCCVLYAEAIEGALNRRDCPTPALTTESKLRRGRE